MAKSLTELKADRYEVQQKMDGLRKKTQQLQQDAQQAIQAANKELSELAVLDIELGGRIKQEEDHAKEQ